MPITQNAPDRIVVAMTGASGVPYARTLLAALAKAGMEVHVTYSDGFVDVARLEDERARETLLKQPPDLAGWTGQPGKYVYHHHGSLAASISSGSFRTRGMIVAPCTAASLANIANGTGKTLVERAAEVTMKEGRKLAILLRESPLSVVALENALSLAKAGVHILPTSPAFYIKPKTIQDLVDHVVARALDLFDVPHELSTRWGE